MTIANSVITLALRSAGILGVGQAGQPEDFNDSIVLLNSMIGMWNHQRTVMVIPGTLATFPNLHTDVSAWTGNENVLLVSLAARLRSAYGLPPDEAMTKAADAAVQILQANNLQQQPPDLAGLPTTCGHVVRLALRAAGRVTDAQGVADGSQDMADGLALLVSMIGQWQRKRWLVWDLNELVLTSTGAQSYTIGPTGDFVMAARPDRVEDAFVRLLSGGANPLDIPLTIIEAREDYAAIGLKSLSTFPAALWYDAGWPVGTVHFWPVVPASAYEMHLNCKALLPTYVASTDALALPPEYLEAVIFNLALRLAMATGGRAPPDVVEQARAALNTLRMANTGVGTLGMPAGAAGRRGSGMAAGSSPAFQGGGW